MDWIYVIVVRDYWRVLWKTVTFFGCRMAGDILTRLVTKIVAQGARKVSYSVGTVIFSPTVKRQSPNFTTQYTLLSRTRISGATHPLYLQAFIAWTESSPLHIFCLLSNEFTSSRKFRKQPEIIFHQVASNYDMSPLNSWDNHTSLYVFNLLIFLNTTASLIHGRVVKAYFVLNILLTVHPSISVQ